MPESSVTRDRDCLPAPPRGEKFIAVRALATRLWPWIAGAVVAILVVWNVISVSQPFFHIADIHQFSTAYINKDADRRKIIPTVAAVHTFGQTLRWWRGTWCGWGAYWRPLTSTAFWLEYKIIGHGNRQDFWQMALVCSHLIFTVVLGFFSYRFTKRIGVALLAVLLFAGIRSLWPISTLFNVLYSYGQAPLKFVPADVALHNWIDQPEAWFATFALLALLSTMRGRWWTALGCVVLSIMFKEPGWLTFPMILIFLIMTRRLSEVPRGVYLGILIACLALVAFRAFGAHSVHIEHMSWSNRAWPKRYGEDIFGYITVLLLSDIFAPVLIAIISCLIVIKLRRPPWVKTLAIIASVGVIAAITGLLRGVDAITYLLVLLDPSLQLWIIVGCFAYFYVAYHGWQSSEVHGQLLVLFPLIMFAALPQALDLQDGSDHVDYFPLALQSLLVAIVIAGAWRQWRGISDKEVTWSAYQVS